MKAAWLVAAGGALGRVLRWWTTSWVQRLSPTSSFAWGTLLVNVLGSFAIGALMTLAVERTSLSSELRLLLVTGVLGGFTTFSAYSFETLALLRSGQSGAALAYSMGSVALGLVAAFAGRMAALRA